MPIVCLDTEYDARYTDRGVSRLACMTYAVDGGEAKIVGYADAVRMWVDWARDPAVSFVVHSGYHDFAVLADEAHLQLEGELSHAPGFGPYWELSHALYDAGRVYDTEIAQRLTHIRFGPHKASVQLGALAKQLFGVDSSAEKTVPADARELLDAAVAYSDWPADVLTHTPWRVKFGMLRELHGNDVASYPREAIDYALEDARMPMRLRDYQRAQWRRSIPNLRKQITASWVLHMVSIPGWCADRERAQGIRTIYRKTVAYCEDALLDADVLEIDGPRPVQKQDKLKALVFAALGASTPVSKTLAKACAKEFREPTLAEHRESAVTDARTCLAAIVASGGPDWGATPKPQRLALESALQDSSATLTQLRGAEPWTPLFAHVLRGRLAKLAAAAGEPDALTLHTAATEVLERCGVLEIVTNRTIKSKRVQERVYFLLGKDAPLTDKGYELFGRQPTPQQRLEFCSKDSKAVRAAILAKGATPMEIADAVEQSEIGPEAFEAWLEASGEGVLNALAVRSKADKTIVNFLDKLDTPRRVRTAYVTTVDTGRTSSRSINIQQLPRDYDKPKHLHVRGCITPDPGWAFVVADYSQLELCALAYILTQLVRHYAKDPTRKQQAERILRFEISESYTSELAQAINAGQDCHVRMASVLRSSSYAECIALYKIANDKKERGEPLSAADKSIIDDRQLSKPANFGFPGGLGALSFVDYAAGYGVAISAVIAKHAQAAYMRAWPEMRLYFWHIKQLITHHENSPSGYGLGSGGVCKQIKSKRERGDCSFTQWANGWFQGLAADGAKYAGKLLVDAAYRQSASPMYGTRPSGFVHDEYLVSATREQAPIALPEVERLMVAGMRAWIPDVKIQAPGKVLYERWAK